MVRVHYNNWNDIRETLVASLIVHLRDTVLGTPGGLMALGNSLIFRGFPVQLLRSPIPNRHASEVAVSGHKYVLVVRGSGAIGNLRGWSRRRTRIPIESHTITMYRFWSRLGELRAYGRDDWGFYVYHVQLHENCHSDDDDQDSSSSTGLVHSEEAAEDAASDTSESTKSFDELLDSTTELFEALPHSPRQVGPATMTLDEDETSQHKRPRMSQELETSGDLLFAEDNPSSSVDNESRESDDDLLSCLEGVFDEESNFDFNTDYSIPQPGS